MKMHNSRYLALSFLICAVIVCSAACLSKTSEPSPVQYPAGDGVTTESGDIPTSWMTIPITDTITGTQTTIADLALEGKPVIMHTFAVWCPACSMQLRATSALVQKEPGRFVIVGVDIDPRENSAQVKNHVQKNRFEGMYAAAPAPFTRSLMDTVGDQIVRSLPQTIIICNTSVTYIGDGVFSENSLESILSEICP